MVEERELSGASLAAALTALVEAPAALVEMEAASRRLGRPDAAGRVADLLLRRTEAPRV
jgi:UDP-N-acetylglucosamine--N-acetylmuramyl-(pentapeptide) pyrophosphoryl-undecaprenol N-acetylglucosamine transferase